MSLVIGIIRQDYGIIAGDGRAIYNNGLIDENYKKVIKLNDNVYIGFAGNISDCSNAVSILSDSDKKNEYTVKSAFDEVKRYYDRPLHPNEKMQMIIIGRGVTNKIVMRTISVAYGELKTAKHNPSNPDDIQYSFAGFDINIPVKEWLESNIQKTDDFLTAARDTICAVAAIDGRVNDVISHYEIEIT